ncbi:fibrinogen C domain-containing protein 1-like [Anopheles albimanus]|uniref:fibrinogen C domain-containing protein 1-like n=1 Tax=Anopheles albimanus TaxID=7167 RepID=UPI001641C0B2|nr:fibrinogen C domain-containing protein 1-like [Anopheles albimanus]
MKSSVWIIFFCVAIPTKASDKFDDNTVTTITTFSGCGFELLFAKLDGLQQKLEKIQSELDEHQTTQEKILDGFHSLEREIRCNFSPPHDRSSKGCDNLSTDIAKQTSFSSCKDVPSNVSGRYLIRLNDASVPFPVYCEQFKFGGGWLVFQLRYDGSLDFYRDWNEYREGFGDLRKEFWLGLEKLHQLTSARRHELLVEMRNLNDDYGYARFRTFEIGSEDEGYSLKKLGEYSGTAGDSLKDHKGMKFSTKDRENDENKEENCAHEYYGAWWYKACHQSNLNGGYMNYVNTKSMSWFSFNNSYQGMKYSRMMIRPKN